MSAPTDHLLITLASVPPGSRVLDLGTGASESLASLGFEVRSHGPAEAADLPDAHADWVAVALPEGARADVLPEARRVLRPGGWLWLAVEGADPEDLLVLALDADLALAERPSREGAWSRGIFRRVEEGVRV